MLFALCLTSFQAHAQRYLPGMKGLQVTAGMTDGVHWNAGSDFAYHIGAAYSIYTKNANRWVIGGEYLHKKYDYKDMWCARKGNLTNVALASDWASV